MNLLPGKLQVDDLLIQLETSQRLSATQAAKARSQKRDPNTHAIHQIAAFGLADQAHPGKKLTALTLTQWLAEALDLAFIHIDPLKVDVESLASIMSYEYAKRYSLLPLKVSADRVQIATSEPLLTGWEETIAQVTRRKIDKFLAVPDDIARFGLEFYALNRSVTRASGKGQGSGLRNLPLGHIITVSLPQLTHCVVRPCGCRCCYSRLAFTSFGQLLHDPVSANLGMCG